MTSAVVNETEVPVQDDTAQDTPAGAPQVDVDALLAQAQSDSPIVFGLGTLIRDKFNEYDVVNKEYQDVKRQGEVPVATLLEGITDDENATQLRDAIVNLEQRIEAVKAKARELLAAKGMTNDAAEAEVKTKRDNVRSELNKARQLFEMLLGTNPDFSAKYSDLLAAFTPKASSGTSTSGSGTSTQLADGEAPAIRKWAADNGVKVNDRGRIPGDVVEQYRKAVSAQ